MYDEGIETSFEGRVLLDSYRVGPKIGEGGMGTVWLGEHLGLGKKVAIKLIRPELAQKRETRARFEIEARAAAKLQSRNAVHVYDYGVTEDGLPFIVMEYLEGGSLADRVEKHGPVPAEEVAYIVSEAAKALEKAHALGIVHRDLKPDNIFLCKLDTSLRPGEAPFEVKLVDFGIAKLLDESGEGMKFGGPTRTGTVIGTPNFMSPEQLTIGGTPTPQDDLWSLATCAFAALTGRLPFEGDVLGDIVLKVCTQPLPLPTQFVAGLPKSVDEWFTKACNKNKTVRFQRADELAIALDAAVYGDGIGAAVTEPAGLRPVRYALRANPEALAELERLEAEEEQSSMSTRKALVTGLVVGLALMILALGAIAWQHGKEPPPDPSGAAPTSSR